MKRKPAFLLFVVVTILGTLIAAGTSALNPAEAAPATYVGVDTCKGCHSSQFETWAKTRHAQDFSNYDYHGRTINKYTFANGECASCHVVGYDKPGGYDSKKKWEDQKKLVRIQCETCHGPGSNHASASAANRRSTIQRKPDSAATCQVCHLSSYGAFPRGAATDKNLAGIPRRQTAMLLGVNGYEYPGSNYVSSQHRNVVQGNCVTCHVNTVRPHNLKADLETCIVCHGGAGNFNINGRQDEIKNFLASLKGKLEGFKKAHSQTSKDPATRKETVKWDSKENEGKFLRAQYNLRFVENDGSSGVHNYKYARQLLTDSLTHLE